MTNNITWDSDYWLKRFTATTENFRPLQREVWENTKEVVEAGKYILPDGRVITLNSQAWHIRSTFYSREFTAYFEPLKTKPVISVVPDDCLDTAHKWVNEGLNVSVLNLASRRNPGGGVQKGSSAQEEYLFRCSDYYKFLYRYASYAEEYGLKPSRHQYPMDKNFGGIYTPSVTVFRESQERGYKYTAYPWRVNMIAVAGINQPDTITVDGQERLTAKMVDGTKNKIRTIFRIACEQGQRNLVLGALGCGAFKNPPEHVAELFRDVINEEEFAGAFLRLCFAVKSSHSSGHGRNYNAFKKVLEQ